MMTTKQIETGEGPVRVTTNIDDQLVVGPISGKPVIGTVTTYQHIKTGSILAVLISVEDAGRRVEDFTLMASPEHHVIRAANKAGCFQEWTLGRSANCSTPIPQEQHNDGQ